VGGGAGVERAKEMGAEAGESLQCQALSKCVNAVEAHEKSLSARLRGWRTRSCLISYSLRSLYG